MTINICETSIHDPFFLSCLNTHRKGKMMDSLYFSVDCFLKIPDQTAIFHKTFFFGGPGPRRTLQFEGEGEGFMNF
jgi:hypothetical protein